MAINQTVGVSIHLYAWGRVVLTSIVELTTSYKTRAYRQFEARGGITTAFLERSV